MCGGDKLKELLIAFVAGGSVSAIVNGVSTYIMYKSQRKDNKEDEKEDETDCIKKALRYIMLYIIQDRAEEYIRRGEITIEERRSLHKWHDLYHHGLDGNGDADLLMGEVDTLNVKVISEG